MQIDTLLNYIEKQFEILNDLAPEHKQLWDDTVLNLQNELIKESPQRKRKRKRKILKYPKEIYTHKAVRINGVNLRGINGNKLRVAIHKKDRYVHILVKNNWSDESIKQLDKIYVKFPGKECYLDLPCKTNRPLTEEKIVNCQKVIRGFLTRKKLIKRVPVEVSGKTVNVLCDMRGNIIMEKLADHSKKIKRDIIKKFLPHDTSIRHNNKRDNTWVGSWDSHNQTIVVVREDVGRIEFSGKQGSAFHQFAKKHYEQTRQERGASVNAMTEVEIRQKNRWVSLNQATLSVYN